MMNDSMAKMTVCCFIAFISLSACGFPGFGLQPYECSEFAEVESLRFDLNNRATFPQEVDAFVEHNFGELSPEADDYPRLSYCIGRLYLFTDRPVDAQHYFSKSIEFRPNVPGTYFDRAWARLNISQCELALQDIKFEVSLGHDFPGLSLLSAKANYECGYFSDALKNLDRHERQNMSGYVRAEDLILRGRILVAMENYAEALERYYAALSDYLSQHHCRGDEICINPMAAELANDIIDVHCKIRQDAEARDLYVRFENYRQPSVDWPWCVADSKVD